MNSVIKLTSPAIRLYDRCVLDNENDPNSGLSELPTLRMRDTPENEKRPESANLGAPGLGSLTFL